MIVIDYSISIYPNISGGYATEDEELPVDVYNPTDIDVILRPDLNTIRNVPWYQDNCARFRAVLMALML